MDTILDTLHHVWTAFNSLPPEVLTQLGQVLITVVIGSPLFVVVKKLIIREREKLMAAVVFIGTVLAGAAIFLSTMPHNGIWENYTAIIATVQGLVTYAAITPFYIFIVKPIYRRLNAWWISQVAEAASQLDIKSAAVPADGLSTDTK